MGLEKTLKRCQNCQAGDTFWPRTKGSPAGLQHPELSYIPRRGVAEEKPDSTKWEEVDLTCGLALLQPAAASRLLALPPGG